MVAREAVSAPGEFEKRVAATRKAGAELVKSFGERVEGDPDAVEKLAELWEELQSARDAVVRLECMLGVAAASVLNAFETVTHALERLAVGGWGLGKWWRSYPERLMNGSVKLPSRGLRMGASGFGKLCRLGDTESSRCPWGILLLARIVHPRRMAVSLWVALPHSSSAKYARFNSFSLVCQPGITRSSIPRNRSL